MIGCGTISKIYMDLTTKFSIVDLVGCSDLISERSAARAETFGVKQMTNDESYDDPEIEVVMNLTFPEAHYEVSKEALMAGKHVCVEKMMTVTMAEATELFCLAQEKNLLFGVAPDTFLGGGWQSARKYVDDGLIGRPISIAAVCTTNYSPNTPLFDVDPDYFFFPLHPGGGVPYDLGGYYLHNMINLLGSVRRVSGFGGNINPDRMYDNPHHPKYKEPFRVETETTIAGALEFENGCVGTILFHPTPAILIPSASMDPMVYWSCFIEFLQRSDSEAHRIRTAPKFAPPSPPISQGPFVRGVMSSISSPCCTAIWRTGASVWLIWRMRYATIASRAWMQSWATMLKLSMESMKAVVQAKFTK